MSWIESLKALSEFQTVLSAALAIALAVAGYVRTTRENRQRYTLDVLMRYSNNAELLRSLHRLRSHAAASPEDIKVDEALEQDLAVTVPHFAAIALAANCGLLDQKIIIEARYASMQSLWKSYGPYLARRSKVLGRPLLHADITTFLARNASRYESYQLRRLGSSGVDGRDAVAARPAGS